MKQLIGHDVGSYTFSASGGTVTISGVALAQEQILLVTDTTAGATLYLFNSATFGGSWNGGTGVLTLDVSTISLSDSDHLQIYVDVPGVVQAVTNPALSELSFTGYGSPPTENLNVYVANPVTATVSGSVSVSNFPASYPVTGAFWQATQPVSVAGTVNVNLLSDDGTYLSTSNYGTAPPAAGSPPNAQALAVNAFVTNTVAVNGTVAFSNTTIAVTNAGTFPVQISGSISNTSFGSNTNDGSGNPVGSTTEGSPPTRGLDVHVQNSSPISVTVGSASYVPAAINSSGQVSVGVYGGSPPGPTLIIAANANRQAVMITNPSATVTVYWGAAGVTTSTGGFLLPNSSITVPTTAAIWAVVASSTQTVSYVELD